MENVKKSLLSETIRALRIDYCDAQPFSSAHFKVLDLFCFLFYPRVYCIINSQMNKV